MSDNIILPVNSGVGLVDVEAAGEKVLQAMRPSNAQQILNWIEDELRKGNVIYAADLDDKNPIFEERRDGSYQFNIVVQPLRGAKPDAGNESPA